MPRIEQSDTVAPLQRTALPKPFEPDICVLQHIGQQVPKPKQSHKHVENEHRNRDLNGLQDCTQGNDEGTHSATGAAGMSGKPPYAQDPRLRFSRTCTGTLPSWRTNSSWATSTRGTAPGYCSGNIVQRVSTCFVCFKHWSKRGRDDDPMVNRNENYSDQTQDMVHNSKRHKGIMSKNPHEIQIITLRRSAQNATLPARVT